MEIILVLGFLGFLVFKWFDTEPLNKNSRPPNVISPKSTLVRVNPVNLVDSDERQAVIKRAIASECGLRITYKDLDGNITARTITPHQLFLTDGGLALSSYCHLRRQNRTFIVNRIQEAKLAKLN